MRVIGFKKQANKQTKTKQKQKQKTKQTNKQKKTKTRYGSLGDNGAESGGLYKKYPNLGLALGWI